MSGDIFLDLDGIKGESEDPDFKDKIQLETFSWGGSNPTSFVHGSGGGVSKVSLQDAHCTKVMDSASPNLYQVCCNGKHIPKAVITFRKAGEKQQKYSKITLTDVMVASFSLQDHSAGGGLAQETISLAYGKIELEYKPQTAKGDLGGAIPFGWDIKQNKQP